MKAESPSQTAAWVAAARSLGQLLPKEQQLAFDPYGVAFVEPPLKRLTELVLRRPALLQRALPRLPALRAFLLWMQLRTRALDDVLREFLAGGGRQVVLLGAGYDCRAVRFAHLLRDARVLEVDHPATQAHKLRVVSRAELRSQAQYVAWDFEQQALSALGPRLLAEGLSPKERVLTLWEGVTMYLAEPAIHETFELVRGYGAAGSWLAFTYLDRRALGRPRGDQRVTQRLVSATGEPYRSGFDPSGLPAWLRVRHYQLAFDLTDRVLAGRHLEAGLTRYFAAANRHIALAVTGT